MKEDDILQSREIASFWRFISSSIDRLVACLEGLNEHDLNWKPLATANSLYVLATHTLANTEENILSVLCGQPVQRQRETEFKAQGNSAAAIQIRWEQLRKRILENLTQLSAAELDREREHPRRGRLIGREVLTIVARHTAEHLGQAELTRDLLLAERSRQTMIEQSSLTRSGQPHMSRPYMPDYGILDAQSGAGLLPWRWASERLEQARNYWLATSRPDGQPHLTPIWGVWLEETFYFSTGPRSRKARNLGMDPRCVVCPDHTDETVILEGIAGKITNPALLKKVAETLSQKYQWAMEPTQMGVRDQHGNEGPVFAVQPRVVFGFSEDLTGSATRWIFKPE